MAQRAEFADTVVILVLVLGNDEAAAVLAGQWPLGIELALVKMRLQGVKLQYCWTAVQLIVASDAQAAQ